MKTLVVTSINPYSKIAYQSACFYGWRKLGYQIISFNNKQEKECLLKYGFEPLDIVEISNQETAHSLFAKAAPRVLPILVRSAKFGAENIILVNSDIYPGHTHDIAGYLGSIADAIAMTRSDFIAQPMDEYSGDTHYRGGLDIFFFTADGLTALLDNLTGIPVAARMTFGVPGWDFFLGHEIAHVHSGAIMDGAVLFHRHHKTSYSDAKEFESYAGHLFESGIYKNSRGIDLVWEFSSTIQSQCIRNEGLSRKLSEQFYEAFRLDFDNTSDSSEITLIYKKYLVIKKKFSINLRDQRETLTPLIANQSSGEYWEGAVFYKNTKLLGMPPIEGYLLVLLIAMLVKDSRRASNITTIYPVGNLHNVALRRIMGNPGHEGIEVEVVKLFASELVDYSIFNMELFRYIAFSSYTKQSLALCNGILLLCQKGLVRSAASYYNVAPPLAPVTKARLEDYVNRSDMIRNVNLAKDVVKSIKSIVIQNTSRLAEGGIVDIRYALYMLLFFEDILMPDMDETEQGDTEQGDTDLFWLLREPVRQYIEKHKSRLLEEDLHNIT